MWNGIYNMHLLGFVHLNGQCHSLLHDNWGQPGLSPDTDSLLLTSSDLHDWRIAGSGRPNSCQCVMSRGVYWLTLLRI